MAVDTRKVLFDDYIIAADGTKISLQKNGQVTPADQRQWSYHFYGKDGKTRNSSYIIDSFGNSIALLNDEADLYKEIKRREEEQEKIDKEWQKTWEGRNVILESASGAHTSVLFEFPNYKNNSSKYILMKSIISISCSTSVAKMPVITLGENTVQGFAIGNKTVAGSIIKTLMYNDELDNVITYYRSNAILEKEKEFLPDPSSKSLLVFGDNTYQITQKQFLDETMRDDLIPFNIYTYSFSEYSSMKGGNVLMNSIYGCTLINEGQVQSIENLVTENTFTYVAKYARLGHTVTPTEKSVPAFSAIKSGSQLLAAYKT